MSAYDELLDRCARIAKPFARDYAEALAKDILSEVYRTLRTVTPEMEKAADHAEYAGEELWPAMLSASPLCTKGAARADESESDNNGPNSRRTIA